ncbi:dihydrofolate reductase family protein [Tsukamurella sp. 1534]|uniref:dihydrofolate reductase family protein n=1 Tax=Tsukamurella sp. 1534 TaxID=1151061 RepID=UPI00031FC372|nr:dihydrofolate reductase family protein [Tsukamurella sp. 1534]
MRKVTFSMGMTADGYIVGPDGEFDWSVPAPDVFRFAWDEVRALGVHLMGRKLYETMRYWETVDPAALDPDERGFAASWNPLPKVVFSRTLTEVDGSAARLATGGLAEEIARLRAEPGEGDIGIGGATLAAEAARLGLIDEYRIRTHPFLLGGGLPLFPHDGRQEKLEVLDTRAFPSGVTFTHYRVVR